jgi:hypothetical protein
MALARAGIAFFGVQPAGATSVSTEGELRAAWGDASETTITLTADIDLTCEGGGELLRNSGQAVRPRSASMAARGLAPTLAAMGRPSRNRVMVGMPWMP